ncbi:DUF695 domain-containing protein [Jeongeupia naejangsanensis]|uniref:DUF695 domain-containing protein n=1 Tax=Jeongeupia naejangsanensis TaxID=613195 RepID=A0ABS2BKN1_9NEIS|nr:DUF695 domain-containing protein [Jeongeupia naejangsanensis]MBM3116143.1 DUF695 domain-containing protein [Jeongeupia naejangsanensis]
MVTWVLAQSSSPNGIHLLRLAQFEHEFSFRKFPERLHITWTYRSGANFAPSDADLQEMEEFENRLCERIESASTAQLIASFTEPSYREYIFHARDTKPFLKILNSLPNFGYKLPIEVSGEFDAEGMFYHSYAGTLIATS